MIENMKILILIWTHFSDAEQNEAFASVRATNPEAKYSRIMTIW